MKRNIHIEIVCSTAKGLSSMSLVSRNAILGVLSKHYSRVGITIVNNLSDLKHLVAKNPDLVFLGMKFIPVNPELGQNDPNKIWIAGYLDEHDIAYTGSGQSAHNLELNKPLAKQCVLDAGLDTSSFCVAFQDQVPLIEDVTPRYPVFIKPTNSGGGVGVDSKSLAYNFEDLQSKVQSLSNTLQSDSLIEEYLPGREFSVAILKDELSAEYSIMPLELIAPADINGARLLSAQVKSADTESFKEVTDYTIKTKISTLAINVFHALGARDYGRIDIRLDEYGTPHFLEANLIPSLIEGYGNFPKACLVNINLEYEQMILSIVRLGLARSVEVDDELLVSKVALPVFGVV